MAITVTKLCDDTKLWAAQHRLQATRLRRLLAEVPRAQTGLLLKALRRTRRAPEPYR